MLVSPQDHRLVSFSSLAFLLRGSCSVVLVLMHHATREYHGSRLISRKFSSSFSSLPPWQFFGKKSSSPRPGGSKMGRCHIFFFLLLLFGVLAPMVESTKQRNIAEAHARKHDQIGLAGSEEDNKCGNEKQLFLFNRNLFSKEDPHLSPHLSPHPTSECRYVEFTDLAQLKGAVNTFLNNSTDTLMYGPEPNDWCVGKVTSFNQLFKDLPFNEPINDWDVSSVTDIEETFNAATFNQPINDWDVSAVTRMGFAFQASDFDNPLSKWDVSSVTDMAGMFGLSVFNQPINNWNVSSVTDMFFFMADQAFFDQPLNGWDVSRVTDMDGMFDEAIFNQPINGWDVSSVRNMNRMFVSSNFNHPLNKWNVSSVTIMTRMFAGAFDFNQPINNWDVSRVRKMGGLFLESDFNQPINDWDVSRVRGMSLMFESSTFNQSINTWDVSRVTDMTEMFSYAGDFDQNLCAWASLLPTDVVVGCNFCFKMFEGTSCTSESNPVVSEGGPFCETCGGLM